MNFTRDIVSSVLFQYIIPEAFPQNYYFFPKQKVISPISKILYVKTSTKTLKKLFRRLFRNESENSSEF